MTICEGLNFLVDFNYPATSSEFIQPILIILHDSMETPDVENIQGRNFFVYPGVEQTLTIRTTVINSTSNFDSMGIETRHCDENKLYKEINCVMDKVGSNTMMSIRESMTGSAI